MNTCASCGLEPPDHRITCTAGAPAPARSAPELTTERRLRLLRIAHARWSYRRMLADLPTAEEPGS